MLIPFRHFVCFGKIVLQYNQCDQVFSREITTSGFINYYIRGGGQKNFSGEQYFPENHHLLSFQLKCSSNIDSIHYLRLTNSFHQVPEIFIHFLWKSQFQVFDNFWSLPFYLWLVSSTNNKGDWRIQTIQQEVYNYTRKCMNISGNLIKWIGQPEVMYWINIWGTLQLERQ
jgi:hypothetical protein